MGRVLELFVVTENRRAFYLFPLAFVLNTSNLAYTDFGAHLLWRDRRHWKLQSCAKESFRYLPMFLVDVLIDRVVDTRSNGPAAGKNRIVNSVYFAHAGSCLRTNI